MTVYRYVRAVLRFVPNRWWTYPPYLPVPPWNFVSFRLHTFYGRNRVPPLGDLVRFLRWAVAMQRTR